MLKKRLSLLGGVALTLFGLSAAPLFGQGVTTGAISGTITNDQAQGVESAQIGVVNQTTGSRSGAISRSDGRFYIQGLEVGGPYTLTVRRLGFTPRDTGNVYILLGQNARVD